MNIGEPAPGEMTRRTRAQPALSENLFNNLDLMAAMLAPDNLRRAWQRVKSNKGAPGIDGITIEDFSAHARQHWSGIRQAIEQGNYQPTAVRRVTIPKPNGGQRLLGIPTVTDRVIQQAIAQVLTPEFDPRFSESSFGFRAGRNAHMAVRQVQTYIKAGYKWAVDIDLAKFFDTVNHDLLMSLLGRRFRDKRLLALDRKSTRLNSSHIQKSRMPSSA